jgi:hypothetical protein
MNVKRTVSTALVAASLAACLAVPAAAIDLYVDNTKLVTDVEPTIVSGRTLVPVRAIFEALGATVDWDNTTRTATGTKGDTTVTIQIDSTTAYVNGTPVTLDVPAQIIDSRTMVPARFISESLGADVAWDGTTQTVYVTTQTGDAIVSTADQAQAEAAKTVYVTKTGKRYHYDSSCNGGTYYASTLSDAVAAGLTPCEKCVQ